MTARVLIVDDIPTNVRLLEARLAAEYYDVVTASSGAEALDICATQHVDIVLLDVRSPDLFEQGHVPGAVNLPHRRIVERNLERFPDDALFVVYCAGPHCNGADKAAMRLAALGRPVKKMIGGVEGWKDEGFELATGTGPVEEDAS